MSWIPTQPNQFGDLTINELTFTKPGVDNYWLSSDPDDSRSYRYHDGFLYIEDHEHNGIVYITKNCAHRYGFREGQLNFGEIDEEDREFLESELGSDYPYTHVVGLSHCAGVVNGDGIDMDLDSPRGDTTDDDFVAWFNGFSDQLFYEPRDELYIRCMRDG